jgi:pyruvate/2-oxoglutarate dehydrogenase complex dihydrolipoamide acyltransferase (E2) component
VPGTGKGGRITKDDLLNFIASKAAASTEQIPQVSALFYVRLFDASVFAVVLHHDWLI